MKINSNLPFSIGEQYENWEFELEILPDIINGYDSYVYAGSNFKIKKDKVKYELLFSLDILEAVIITYKSELTIIESNLDLLFKNVSYKKLLLKEKLIIIYGLENIVELIYVLLQQNSDCTL
jgi:hypothetical protein